MDRLITTPLRLKLFRSLHYCRK